MKNADMMEESTETINNIDDFYGAKTINVSDSLGCGNNENCHRFLGFGNDS